MSDIAFYIALVGQSEPRRSGSVKTNADETSRPTCSNSCTYDVTFDELRRTQKYKSVKRRVADVKHIHFTEDDERRQQ